MQLYGKNILEPYSLAKDCLDNPDAAMATEDACHAHTYGRLDYSHITVRCSETIKPDLLFEQVALTKKELRCCPVQHTI